MKKRTRKFRHNYRYSYTGVLFRKDKKEEKELGKYTKPRLFTKNIASCKDEIRGTACPVTKSLTAAVF